jgi:hypothetical protein
VKLPGLVRVDNVEVALKNTYYAYVNLYRNNNSGNMYTDLTMIITDGSIWWTRRSSIDDCVSRIRHSNFFVAPETFCESIKKSLGGQTPKDYSLRGEVTEESFKVSFHFEYNNIHFNSLWFILVEG